jgi:mono/diheme cytochrome c family protein
MAATDQLYRSQKTMDIVFGVSCAAMLLTTLWMFADDYYRPFKKVQRTFRDVEATLAEREAVDKLPDPDLVKQKNAAVRRARRDLEQAKAFVAGTERDLKAQREKADEAYRGVKADYDSLMSYYNIAIDDAGQYPEESPRGKAYKKEAEEMRKRLDKLEAQLTEGKSKLDAIDAQIKSQVGSVTEGPEKELAAAEEELKKISGASDRFAKQAAQRAWSTGDTIRALPILDGFESPTKIKQIWLPDLTIDYSFKEVPRYDRCTTCHLGIDRNTFEREALTRLRDDEEASRLTGKLNSAKELLERRYDPVGDSLTSRVYYNLFGHTYKNLGFSPDDLPGERTGHLGLVMLIMLACSLVGAGSLGILERSVRVGVRVLTAGLALTLLTAGALAVFSPKETKVKKIDLSNAQITQYATHPRLDLFVDANSPHSMEKFGCTICHQGQGSATEFNLASHTPNGAVQEDGWRKEHHYHANHYWDYPMLPNRFVESSCLKCHHQVTDLIRHGSKEEAPKLLKGYNLVREMGCFGCHEIQGLKGGRPVGPDMRLEPTPALELLSAADQEKAKSDPLNPPGGYRKVGPSLRRLSEKTNADWVLHWINEPRGFRPDTKMPHFYNLSTNSKEALPEDQKNFPAAEIHAIAHYLMQESKAHLEAKDAYREALLKGKNNLIALQERLAKTGLSDKDMKELSDVSRRFVDLALLSAPARQRAINAAATTQRQLQEKLGDLHKRGAEGDAKKEIDAAYTELKRVTNDLITDAKPDPIAKGLVNGEGEKVTLPAKEGDAERGRELFTEKGCLACHAHEGTTKKGGKTHPVTSEANFAPELSRIADKVSSREWLVQWILNPNVHHPRTRMPVTHLTPEQANDVAAWLLSQKTNWKGTDPGTPTLADYKSLARVYLAKAPGVTRAELDAFLPEKGDDLPGIPKERLENFARDAEERALEQGKVTQDALMWYVGKKAIGRQGCYGCHDISGFETAKLIGTGLNDWGKKDGERLAFEDAETFVKEHFNIVPSRTTRGEVEKRKAELEARPESQRTSAEERELKRLTRQVDAQARIEELEKKALEKGLSSRETEELQKLRPLKFFEPVKGEKGAVKEPFEESFYRALEHHQREGFLHLKLFEPRSYDYNRIKTWDDRLRMPQFKFARGRQKEGESKEAYEARQEKEEAEAREAVMTFILGLVADPIPLKYVANPGPEKKAEAAGRQVLDKFNCGGCHQIRPGVYEFKASEVQALLDRAFGDASRNFVSDHVFQNHNAWFGTPPPSDRLTALGYTDPVATEKNQDTEGLAGTDTIRLAEALRFQGSDKLPHDLPAGSSFYLPKDGYRLSGPFGGTFTDLMVPYLTAKNSTNFPRDDAGKARTVLPPPLVREGERAQPDWLYKFLLNPPPIRPQLAESSSGILLRMPKFNMSPEEARAIVNYFAAVPKLTNPGAGVTAPYVFIEQREPEYWRRTTAGYEASLKDLLAAAQKELAASAKDPERQKGWQARIKLIEAAQKSEAPKDAKVTDLYSRQAYKLLTHRDLCLKCHPVGNIKIEGAQGPNLALAAERLRPEWVEEWVAHPTRMFTYNPVMPQNFPANPDPLQWTYQDAFVGTPSQQARAVRDLIMDQARLAELIATIPPPPPPPAPKDTKDAKK